MFRAEPRAPAAGLPVTAAHQSRWRHIKPFDHCVSEEEAVVKQADSCGVISTTCSWRLYLFR